MQTTKAEYDNSVSYKMWSTDIEGQGSNIKNFLASQLCTIDWQCVYVLVEESWLVTTFMSHIPLCLFCIVVIGKLKWCKNKYIMRHVLSYVESYQPLVTTDVPIKASWSEQDWAGPDLEETLLKKKMTIS